LNVYNKIYVFGKSPLGELLIFKKDDLKNEI